MTEKQTLEIINQVVSDLDTKGMILFGQHYCFAMSEIVQNMLRSAGLESRLVECSLTLMVKTPPMLKMVGHGLSDNTEKSFDTHMVVITDTDPEFLIDLSQGLSIVLPVDRDDHDLCLASYEDQNHRIFYRQKAEPSYPPSYNQNVMARMRSERDIRRNLQWLKIIVITLLTISSANAIRGFYDFYQVYVVNNNWGPEAVSRQQLYNRVDQLDQKIDQLIERQRR